MSRGRRNPVNRRLRLLLMFLIAGFAVLLGRAAWLQGGQAGSLSSLATKQHRATVVLPASRGTIFDRTGVQLAIGEQATTVYADPRQVRDPRAVATAAGPGRWAPRRGRPPRGAPGRARVPVVKPEGGFRFRPPKTRPGKSPASGK